MKENLFYLPPYEDEATAEKIREIYGYLENTVKLTQ